MERITTLSKRFLLSYRILPQKKHYLEFVTTVLSIPVLITGMILNYNAVNNLSKAKTAQNQPQKVVVAITAAPGTTAKVYTSASTDSTSKQPVKQTLGATAAPQVTQAPCKKELGPFSIDTPDESDTVTDNPVSVNFSYDDNTYCAAVWSYRVNGGSWSDYDDKSLALYNLPQGTVKLDVKVKSIVADGEKSYSRTFTYKGPSVNTLNSQTSSSSAN